MVDPLLKQVPSFQKLSSSRTDDWIDRMSHIYTVFLLLIFAVLISTSQFVGDPIHCWCPAEFKDWYVAYAKSYCWIKNTYYIPMTDQIPVDIRSRQDEELTYYQWVPLILLFQAFLFKFPNVVWKLLNSYSGINLSKICKLADDTQCHSPDDRKKAINNMAHFIDKWINTNREYRYNVFIRIKATASRFCFLCNKREGTYLTGMYLATKILYVLNVISQFFILNAFMASKYNVYGFEYLDMLVQGTPMTGSPRFPRVTLCDFEIRQLQNIQRWTIQCVLPINLFNEKIFIFLWFWLFFIAALAVFNLLKWLVLIAFKKSNHRFVKKHLMIADKMHTASDENACQGFADKYLRDDGCFVVRVVGLNSTELVVTDLLGQLWENYKNKSESKPITDGM